MSTQNHEGSTHDFAFSHAWPTGAALLAWSVWLCAAEQPVAQSQREQFQKALVGGNFKVAYDGFRKLALDPQDDPGRVAGDLQAAIQALQQLGRVPEIDEFMRGGDRRRTNRTGGCSKRRRSLHETIASSWLHHRRQVRTRQSSRRRPVRQRGATRVAHSLQLMNASTGGWPGQEDRAKSPAGFHLRFASSRSGGSDRTATRGGCRPSPISATCPITTRAITVTAERRPAPPSMPTANRSSITSPRSFDRRLESDGERWRWLLAQAAEFDPSLANESEMRFANFLREQFGVQTMAQFGIPWCRR